jgi:hypothetical protein
MLVHELSAEELEARVKTSPNREERAYFQSALDDLYAELEYAQRMAAYLDEDGDRW